MRSNTLEYFPFNPSFQTSEEIRTMNMDPDEKYLEKIDEYEQVLILKAIKNNHSIPFSQNQQETLHNPSSQKEETK